MRRATGRDPGDVATSARCLLAYLNTSDPSAEQIAGAHIVAFGLLDLHNCARALGVK